MAAASAAALIDRCQARLIPEIDVGYARIVRRCPELRTLQTVQPDVVPLLPSGWTRSSDLTAGGLHQLALLLRAVSEDKAQRPPPSLAGLPAALAKFGPEPAASGFWARFRAWLRRALTVPETRYTPPLRASRLDIATPILARLIVGVAVLILLVAAFVLLGHMRATGLLSHARRVRRSVATMPGVMPAPAPPSLAQIARAPLIEQPALLLNLMTPRLGAGAAARTATELCRGLGRAGDTDALANLAPILTVAERIRYGHEVPADSEIRAALRRAQAVALDARC